MMKPCYRHARRALVALALRRPFTVLAAAGLMAALSLFLTVSHLGDRQATYEAESIDGDHAVVRTRLIGGKEEGLSVEYRLASKQGRWGVVDVRIDGVSLAMNYRAQFNRILRTSSYDTLVQRMRKVEGGKGECQSRSGEPCGG